jgi:prepilin-type N-terminal cleavage/methylation domain-containing protein
MGKVPHMRIRNKNLKKQKAFTLIELLVVISIIGLLASIVLVALNGARASARMAVRVSNLNEVKTALELYYNANGGYPATVGGYYTECDGSHNINTVIPPGLSAYMNSLPDDPLLNCSTDANMYAYLSNGVDYKFMIYNVSDVTSAQVISNYTTYADPFGVPGYNPNNCSGSAPFSAPILAIWTTGDACQ